jgi:RHS repeat-associated protein
VTLYSYDALDNLVHVEQHGTDSNPANWRPRNFAYDSLSRLISATNPESGTITYAYDNAGNLTSKTAPAPNQQDPNVTVTTYFSYDALNRLTLRTYSDSSRSATYIYDQSSPWGVNVQNPIGQLVSTFAVLPGWTTLDGSSGGSGVGSVFSYDAMGRVSQDRQFNQHVLPWAPWQTFNYTYNLDGSLNTIQYPSGRTITYHYNAAQRPDWAKDLDNNISYVTNAQYTAAGALSSLDNGSTSNFAGIHTSNTYNSRLQPMTLTATAGVNNVVFNLGYDFHLGNGDNGNVFGVANYRAFDHGRDQSFAYDQLNRLTGAQSVALTGTNCWGEGYGYDAWGNLTSRSVTKCTGEGPLPGADNQNRMAGYGYDAAGNLTEWGFAYNSENQLIQAPLASLKFDYDAGGRRVQKSNGTLYWYGAGSVLEETNLSGALKAEYIFFGGKRIARRDPSGAVHYYFADHLGSTDIVTNATGTVVEEESEYYPFGGERVIIDAGIGNNYKFTGKERDPEDGLDEFGARRYTWYFSRFTTPDWAAKPTAVPYANFGNPQSLNLYSYVKNNPTTFGDPDGHCEGDDCQNIDVKAEVTRQPVMQEMRSGQTDSALVGGEITYTFTYDNKPPYVSKPLNDTMVHEDVKNSTYVNGEKTGMQTITGDDKTDSKGEVPDQSGFGHREPNPSGTGSNKASDYLSQNVMVKDTKQTLTFKSPNGATCKVNETRTTTNADSQGTASSHYIITVTSPRVQTAQPADKPKRPSAH